MHLPSKTSARNNCFHSFQSLRERNLTVAPFLATLALISAMMLATAAPVQAATETVLYTFNSFGDASNTMSGLVQGKKHNLYGVSQLGGDFSLGTIYQVSPTGSEAVLYSFTGGADGLDPQGNLVVDKAGSLYGASSEGGSNAGVVFKFTLPSTFKVLHTFNGTTDGAGPTGGMVFDKLGNLYGTAFRGGTANAGTIFKITPAGTFSVIYNFAGGNDGVNPQGGMAIDGPGNLYGTTGNGGSFGLGTVFKFSTTGVHTVWWSFFGGADGKSPNPGVVFHNSSVYGTTFTGGTGGAGTVFAAHPHSVGIVYSFTGGADGGIPTAGPVFDTHGNLYGTTQDGGANFEGTVYKIQQAVPPITETVLHSFSGNPDGNLPYGRVFFDKKTGFVYGTTLIGGSDTGCLDGEGCGVVFKVIP